MFLGRGREKGDWFRPAERLLCSAVTALKSLSLKYPNDETPPLALQTPVTQVTGSDVAIGTQAVTGICRTVLWIFGEQV